MKKQKRAPRKDSAVEAAKNIIAHLKGISDGATISMDAGTIRQIAKAVLKGVEK